MEVFCSVSTQPVSERIINLKFIDICMKIYTSQCNFCKHRFYIWPLNVEPTYNLSNKIIYVEMTVLSGECRGYIHYYLYHEGGVGYGLYTMRETHIPRGRRPRGMWVSLMVWDHIPLVRKGYMGSYTSSNSGFWFAKNIGHGIKVVSILIYPHPYKVMSPMYKILSVH